MIRSIAFFVYPVSDMARAQAFYEGVLGLKRGMDFRGEWVEYDLGDTTFAITTMDLGHKPGARGGTVAFEVDDLDAFVTGLEAKGVRMPKGIIVTPVCRLAITEDPDGNQVILHKRHA